MCLQHPNESWRWPKHGQNEADTQDSISKIIDLYRLTKPPVCYPGTNLKENIAALSVDVFLKNINLIGMHTHGKYEDGVWVPKKGEGGFEHAQQLEAKVIWMIAGMIGGTPETIDGLFCGGGTEANLQGMWVGRNWLRKHCTEPDRKVPNRRKTDRRETDRGDPIQKGIVILTTPLLHYSIIKNADILDIGEGSFVRCKKCKKSHIFRSDSSGAGVTLVGMNSAFEMDVADLRRVVEEKYAKGFRRFMIVPTVGTTDTGSIDPIEAISSFIHAFEKETKSKFYMHVDASFGGFTVPFVNPELKIGFTNPHVMSMTLDGDKMGRLPYPAGVFLCRKNLTTYIARRVAYVRGNMDDSVSGSRTALPAVLAWYQYSRDGVEGQRKYVQDCLDARNALAEKLEREMSDLVKVMPYSQWTNLLPIMILNDRKELKRHFVEGGILAAYQMRSDRIPHDTMDINSCPDTIYKLCIMPHLLREGVLDTFVENLKRALRS